MPEINVNKGHLSREEGLLNAFKVHIRPAYFQSYLPVNARGKDYRSLTIMHKHNNNNNLNNWGNEVEP